MEVKFFKAALLIELNYSEAYQTTLTLLSELKLRVLHFLKVHLLAGKDII